MRIKEGKTTVELAHWISTNCTLELAVHASRAGIKRGERGKFACRDEDTAFLDSDAIDGF